MSEALPAEIDGILPFRKLTSIDIPDNKCCSFGLIASTRAGKSTMLGWLWEKFFKDHATTVMMTGSPHADIYAPMAKEVAISPAFYPELIKDAMKLNQATHNRYPTLILLDDMLDGKNTKALSKLLCIGRNCGLSAIVSAQELSILSAVGRTNLNFILLGRLNSDMAIEKVIRCYLRHSLPHGSIVDQIGMYKLLTQDHRFICVDALANEVFLTKVDV